MLLHVVIIAAYESIVAIFLLKKKKKNPAVDLYSEASNYFSYFYSYRKSRMKQRSRTHRERRGNDLDTEIPKEDSEFSTKVKREALKSNLYVEVIVVSQCSSSLLLC